MSRWTAASDLDYLAESLGGCLMDRRTCYRCGAETSIEQTEEYQLQVICSACYQRALDQRQTAQAGIPTKQGAA